MSLSLASVVDDKLAKVRAMSVADIYSLSEHSTREIETTWKSRRSVSVYALRCSDGRRLFYDQIVTQINTCNVQSLPSGGGYYRREVWWLTFTCDAVGGGRWSSWRSFYSHVGYGTVGIALPKLAT